MAAPSRRKHQMPSKRSGSLHRRLWEPLMSELMWSSTSTSGAVVSGAFQGEFASGSPGRGMMRKMPRRSSTLWSQLLRSLQRVSKVWVLRLLRMRIKPSHGLNLLALSAYHESKFENVTLAYCYLPLMTYVIEDSRLCSFLSSAWNFDYFAKSWYLRGVQSTYTWGVITLSHFSLCISETCCMYDKWVLVIVRKYALAHYREIRWLWARVSAYMLWCDLISYAWLLHVWLIIWLRDCGSRPLSYSSKKSNSEKSNNSKFNHWKKSLTFTSPKNFSMKTYIA